MPKETFRIVIEIEADSLVLNVLRDALQGERVRRALKLHLTKALENVLEAAGIGALFINVTGGRLESV